MSFKDQAFGARWLVMGDIAETAFKKVYPYAVRTGLDRAKSTKGLSAFQRYEPDFRIANDPMHRVECMGIGRDQTLKIKYEKLFALIQWSVIEPVDLWVWDQHKKRHSGGPIDGWMVPIVRHGVYAVFPEGKEYAELHAKWFPYEWQAATEAA